MSFQGLPTHGYYLPGILEMRSTRSAHKVFVEPALLQGILIDGPSDGTVDTVTHGAAERCIPIPPTHSRVCAQKHQQF